MLPKLKGPFSYALFQSRFREDQRICPLVSLNHLVSDLEAFPEMPFSQYIYGKSFLKDKRMLSKAKTSWSSFYEILAKVHCVGAIQSDSLYIKLTICVKTFSQCFQILYISFSFVSPSGVDFFIESP